MNTRLSILVVGAAAFALGCAPPPPVDDIRYYGAGEPHTTADGLHRIKDPGGIVFMKPGADLHRYNRVMLDTVRIRYKRGPGRHLTPKRHEQVKRRFREAFEGELRHSKVYTLTDAPGPDVLRVTPSLVDLVISAPEEPKGRADTIVKEGAIVTLILELSDSVSHEPLIRAAQRRQVRNPANTAYVTSETANMAGARILFRHWAGLLRQVLDKVREIPPLPATVAESA